MPVIYTDATIKMLDLRTLNACRAHVALHLTKPDADVTWLGDALNKLNDRAKELGENGQEGANAAISA